MNNQQLQEKEERGQVQHNTPTCHSQQLPATWRSLWLQETWPQINLEIFELYLMIQNCTATSWCAAASTNELCGTGERGWCCCSTFGFPCPHVLMFSMFPCPQQPWARSRDSELLLPRSLAVKASVKYSRRRVKRNSSPGQSARVSPTGAAAVQVQHFLHLGFLSLPRRTGD